jgi:bacillithiol biosynthesis cysteine-adding enzyme BshC
LIQVNSSIKFQDTGYFSKIICDYLDQNETLRPFYEQYPDIEGFRYQIELKGASFSQEGRRVLRECLLEQTKGIELSDLSSHHIDLLQKDTTFTVTTGHQLNLFTGPLYFLYKIISAINLAKELKQHFPKHDFVPVYWMATEDHDFEEICFFNHNGKKVKWDKEVQGAVGRISTSGLEKVYDRFEEALGKGRQAEKLKQLFKQAYLEHDTLTEATRYLANALFAEHGLLILDGDSQALKRLFIPYVREELLRQTSFKKVTETNTSLSRHYDVQVNPREINLFYLDENLRERIIFEEGLYKVNNTDKVYSEEAILQELDSNPEKFSPNVLMRPLYQEIILPNLSYIGGGGEIAYWMQLKDYFKTVEVPFPILLLRNSVLLISAKQRAKMSALGISEKEIFLEQQELIRNKVKEISDLEIDFRPQRKQLEAMFEGLKSLSDRTDKSFTGAVLAQEKKQLNGLDKLEKRLLKAQKRKYHEIVGRIALLQDALFPGKSLQERQMNFADFYEIHGDALIDNLVGHLEPLKLEFDLITL